MRRSRRVSRRRTRRTSRRSRRQSGGWVDKNAFITGATYKVNGPGVDNETWYYQRKEGKYQHKFVTSKGKPVKVYRQGNRWRTGKAGTHLSIVRNTVPVLGRRMLRI